MLPKHYYMVSPDAADPKAMSYEEIKEELGNISIRLGPIQQADTAEEIKKIDSMRSRGLVLLEERERREREYNRANPKRAGAVRLSDYINLLRDRLDQCGDCFIVPMNCAGEIFPNAEVVTLAPFAHDAFLDDGYVFDGSVVPVRWQLVQDAERDPIYTGRSVEKCHALYLDAD